MVMCLIRKKAPPRGHSSPLPWNVQFRLGMRSEETRKHGENSHVARPPVPPPLWEHPCHKKIKVYFAFFGFHQNVNILCQIEVGIGEPPLRDTRFCSFPKKKTYMYKCSN